ncbi:hypothetical protein [Streptomyces sp. NPDC001601]|uniref:hypothetical protein n=1 Tax=Streptomyces sp. NPDC001601 TaxID=3364592 RepID=UPI0036951C6A
MEHWWIIEPVARAILVAEELSAHPELVFADPGLPGSTTQANRDEHSISRKLIEKFIEHVNECADRTGLDEIPVGRVAPRMFRKTMSMLVGTEPGAEIALGQLLEVERSWRDMKQIIDLRPVYHRLEERIRAHVVLCWLALLLIRIIETTTGATWLTLRRELDRLHLGTFTGPTGLFRQVTALTKTQTDLLAKLGIPTPKQIIALEPTPR